MLICDDFVIDYFRMEEIFLLIWRDWVFRFWRDINYFVFFVRNCYIFDYYIVVIFFKVFFIIIIIRVFKILRFFFLKYFIIYLNFFMLKFIKIYDDEDVIIFMI